MQNSEAMLLHWANAATASAKVSLPGVQLKGKAATSDRGEQIIIAFIIYSPILDSSACMSVSVAL